MEGGRYKQSPAPLYTLRKKVMFKWRFGELWAANRGIYTAFQADMMVFDPRAGTPVRVKCKTTRTRVGLSINASCECNKIYMRMILYSNVHIMLVIIHRIFNLSIVAGFTITYTSLMSAKAEALTAVHTITTVSLAPVGVRIQIKVPVVVQIRWQCFQLMNVNNCYSHTATCQG